MKKIFVVAATFVCSQLQAQDSTVVMQQVTVTANKYSTKTTETGKVVTIITQKDLEHAGSRDLSQIITELGGVFINGYNSTAGKEKNIYLRGAKVDYTLITIDGVPVYDASGIGSNFDLRNIAVNNVERIEILKGSQSTLYGSDAIAGVINIITKTTGKKPFEMSGMGSYGSFHTLNSSLNVSGHKNKLEYNVGTSHFNTRGFSEAQQPKSAATAFENDGYNQTGLQASFGLQLQPAIKIAPFFRYSYFKGDLDLDAFTDEKDFTNTTKNLQTGVKSTIRLGKGTLNLTYQYINTKRFYLDDSGFVSSAAYYIFNKQQYTANEHFAEAFAVFAAGLLRVTAGADARFSGTGYHATQKNVYTPQIETDTYGADSVKQQQISLYAAANFLKNKWNVEGGGRLNHHSEYGSNFAFNINPSFWLTKTLKLFVNASSGYKTPGLYQLFSNYGNRRLQPETSINAEGGLQVFTANQKAFFRAVYFNRRLKNVIAFVPVPSYPYYQYNNQDQQKDHGIELEASGELFQKLQLKAQYSYVTGMVTTKANGKDTSYFNLLRRPKSMFNIFTGCQLTKALYINAQLSVVGSSRDVYFDPTTFVQQEITLEPYTLLNFYAEYGLAKNHLKIFAEVRNLMNSNYVNIYGYNTAGRTAYGGVRFYL